MAQPASPGEVAALSTGLSRKFKSGSAIEQLFDERRNLSICLLLPPREFPVDQGDD
jgi:hypothetical protein